MQDSSGTGRTGPNAKSTVFLSVIESMFQRPVAVFPDPAHSDQEERFKAIGKNDEDRSIFVVFTLRSQRGQVFIRPISARYMHQREVDYYEKKAARSQNG